MSVIDAHVVEEGRSLLVERSCIDFCDLRGRPNRIVAWCDRCGRGFCKDREWLALKTTDPDDFAAAVAIDGDIKRIAREVGLTGTPFLNQRRKPLADAVAEYEREVSQNPMLPGSESGAGNECAGVCFV